MSRTRLNRRWTAIPPLLLVASLSLWIGCGSREAPPHETPPPKNILFILTDQLTTRAVSSFSGIPGITPHLDRLAATGVRFENAFSQSPQCCPSRITMLTGRYSRSHGVTWNGIRERTIGPTLPSVLQRAGYATATFGKHHMVDSPKKHGFAKVIDLDDYRRFVKSQGKKDCWEDSDTLDIPFQWQIGTSRTENRFHSSGYLADQAIEFLKLPRAEPFGLWLSFPGPHPPITPSEPWASLHTDSPIRVPNNFEFLPDSRLRRVSKKRAQFELLSKLDHLAITRLYLGLVSQIDYNVGRVLETLDELGLSENTTIVFTSDHGEFMGSYGMWTKAVMTWDCLTRVPLIIKDPDLPQGASVPELVGLVDLFPTLCDLTGHQTPASCQGRSVVSLARGENNGWKNHVYSELGRPDRGGECLMLRTPNFKLIRHQNVGQPLELFYDLSKDPWEGENLIADPAYQKIAAELRQEMNRWDEETERAPDQPLPQGSR